MVNIDPQWFSEQINKHGFKETGLAGTGYEGDILFCVVNGKHYGIVIDRIFNVTELCTSTPEDEFRCKKCGRFSEECDCEEPTSPVKIMTSHMDVEYIITESKLVKLQGAFHKQSIIDFFDIINQVFDTPHRATPERDKALDEVVTHINNLLIGISDEKEKSFWFRLSHAKSNSLVEFTLKYVISICENLRTPAPEQGNDILTDAYRNGYIDGQIVGNTEGRRNTINELCTTTEREKVLKQLHEWFENYCEGNEDPDLWMAYLHAERALRTAAKEQS